MDDAHFTGVETEAGAGAGMESLGLGPMGVNHRASACFPRAGELDQVAKALPSVRWAATLGQLAGAVLKPVSCPDRCGHCSNPSHKGTLTAKPGPARDAHPCLSFLLGCGPSCECCSPFREEGVGTAGALQRRGLAGSPPFRAAASGVTKPPFLCESG